MRRRLPIRIENPCQEDWSSMVVRGAGRHCERCASTVIDLTRVTRSQAKAIARSEGGKVCGRVRANDRGEAVFMPEPARAGLMEVVFAGLLAGCAAEPSEPDAHDEVALTDDGRAPIGMDASSARSFGGSLATGVMMPISPEAPLRTPTLFASTRPTQVVDEHIEPTEAQRTQTRRKHARQHPPSYPPPPHSQMMGLMVLDL